MSSQRTAAPGLITNTEFSSKEILPNAALWEDLQFELLFVRNQ
jgi:hypothetical protein